jgi:hypothetical protein
MVAGWHVTTCLTCHAMDAGHAWLVLDLAGQKHVLPLLLVTSIKQR